MTARANYFTITVRKTRLTTETPSQGEGCGRQRSGGEGFRRQARSTNTFIVPGLKCPETLCIFSASAHLHICISAHLHIRTSHISNLTSHT